MTEAAASGLLLATDVADYLVGKGMPFREAHEVVGALVRRLLDERRSFDSLTLDEWRAHSPLFDRDVRTAITPAASVARKRTPQSTNPDAVATALGELRAWIVRRRTESGREHADKRTGAPRCSRSFVLTNCARVTDLRT